MELTPLTAISPVDGRYRRQTEKLSSWFSEFALIQYRLLVEVEYFIALAEIPLASMKGLNAVDKRNLREIYSGFKTKDAERIKEIELETNHDVKAVEYFLKERCKKMKLDAVSEFVHFGLTSQDINNTAMPLLMKDAQSSVMMPALSLLISKLKALAKQWNKIPMLARTHGQPASPTMLGKEIMVFVERLEAQVEQLRMIPFSAKFGGATGNLNAHHVAYPKVDWIKFSNSFIGSLGLKRSNYTTQIEHYDNLAAFCHGSARINTILIDMSRDVWQYISMDYFKQELKKGEIGSSAMPHKVNPIDFENAEGNLGMANAIYSYLAEKLPVSRLQRDLTDSTVLRNLGVPFAHSLIAFNSLLKGLNKLQLNAPKLKEDLDNNWAVVAEAIQTILRREGFPKPYEALKSITRTHKKITEQEIHSFIGKLKISQKVKAELLKITPHNYTGVVK